MSKIISYALAGLALSSGAAEARYLGPILTKEARTGYTLAEYARFQKCEIFADRTVLTTMFGGAGDLKSVETKNQSLDGQHQELLQKALTTKLVKKNGAVDGPSVQYSGFLVNADDSVTRVTLYQENGGSGQIANNPSSEALILKNVIEALCPNMLKGIGHAP